MVKWDIGFLYWKWISHFLIYLVIFNFHTYLGIPGFWVCAIAGSFS